MSKIKVDLAQAQKVEKLVIRLQSFFRKELSIQDVEGKIDVQRTKLARRAQAEFPEGEALGDFVKQLKAKNITAEQFFRMRDVGYKRQITPDSFKKGCIELNIKLSDTQIKRLILLMDEDMTGTISLEEWQNSLEAFSQQGEKHLLTTEPGKAYKPYDITVLQKYFEVLAKKGISAEELYNSACEGGAQAELSLKDFTRFMVLMKPSLKVKEQQMLFQFYDIDGNGYVSKPEFLSADARAKKAVKLRQSQENSGMFEEEPDTGGDQALPNANAGVKKSAKMVSAKTKDTKAQTIISLADKTGVPFRLFKDIMVQSATAGKVKVENYSMLFASAYSKINDVNFKYLTSLILAPDNKNILVSKIEILSNTYADQDAKVTVAGNMNLIANSIVTWVRTTSPKTAQMSSAQAIQKGLTSIAKDSNAKAAVVNAEVWTKKEAVDIFKTFAIGGTMDITNILKTFPSYDGKTVKASEVVEATQIYATGRVPSNKATNSQSSKLDELIPNYSKMQGPQKTEAATKYIIDKLEKKKQPPIMAFRMADDKQTNVVTPNALTNSFKKLNSALEITLVQESVNSLGNKITSLLFEATYGSDSKSKRPQTAKATKAVSTDSVLRKLENAIAKEGLSVEQVFKKVDANNDGFIINSELKVYLGVMLQGTKVTGADLKMCMQTLDTNHDGKINKQEFSVLFKNAKENVPEDEDEFGEEDDIGGDQSMPVFQQNADAEPEAFAEDEDAAGDQSAPVKPPVVEKPAAVIQIDAGKTQVAKPIFRKKNLTPADEKKRIALVMKLRAGLLKKHLDPQAAFILADRNKDGHVDVQELGKTFEDLKLSDSLKIRQLFDSDQDGTINQAEFNGIFRQVDEDKAKSGMFDEEEEAGDQSAPPKPPPSQVMKAVAKIEIGPTTKNKACNKIMIAAKAMDIDEDALFKLADKNGDGKLDIKEIGKCFETLRLADTLSIRKIFDINKDGIIDRAEFHQILLGKIPESPKKKGAKEKSGGMFDEDEDAAGDQSAPPTLAAAQNSPGKLMSASTLENYEQQLQMKVKALTVADPTEGYALEVDSLWADAGYIPDDAAVMSIFKGFVQIEGYYTKNPDVIKRIVNKLETWTETLSVNDEGRDCYMERTAQITEIFGGLIDDAKEEAKKEGEELQYNALMLHEVFTLLSEIGFDVWEILFASLLFTDVDGLNQLLIDGTFLSESNRIFDEKDDDDVIDKEVYIKDCHERIKRRLVVLHSVVGFGELEREKGQPPVKITDAPVFARIRFKRLIESMRSNIQRPEDKKRMVEKFTSQPRQWLTYFRFFQMLEIDFKCDFEMGKGPENAGWIKDAMANFLDDFGEGYISLNDWAEFLSLFKIELPFEKIEDHEAQARQKKNISPEEFKMTPCSYFKGCKTILNSEVAALKVARQLFNETQGLWSDQDFGPKKDCDKADDEANGKWDLYMKDSPMQMPDWNDVRGWERPSEYNKNTAACFVKDESSASDVMQGMLGDCWLIGAFCMLANRDELITGAASSGLVNKDMIVDAGVSTSFSMGAFPPIFHEFAKKGIYVIRVFNDFKWRYVIIDDRFPVSISEGKLIYGHCKDDTELWVPCIEKAFAKLCGCYQALASGFSNEALRDTTGFVVERIDFHDRDNLFDANNYDKEDFWNMIMDGFEQKNLMGCSATGSTEGAIRVDGENTGILSGHAYCLNDVLTIANTTTPPEDVRKDADGDPVEHRLMRIRNPWGHTEYRQKWSDYSEEMEDERNLEQVMNYIKTLDDDEEFDPTDKNDGTFFINYQTWRDIYSRLFIAIDFPEKWTAIYWKSEWTAKCAGGLPLKNTPEGKKRFATNPQYLFAPTHDTEILISIAQPDGRVWRGEEVKEMHPFKSRMKSINVYIIELEPGQDRVEAFDGALLKTKKMQQMKLSITREQTLRKQLTGGKKYVIIPTQKVAGELGEYYLSVYFDTPLFSIDVGRIDDPSDQFKYIPEEYEKGDKTVPEWKKKLIFNSIDHMIGTQRAGKDKKAAATKAKAVAGDGKVKVPAKTAKQKKAQALNKQKRIKTGAQAKKKK